MFDLPHCGFYRGPQVASCLLFSCAASTASRYLCLLLTEIQPKTHISFARSGRALPSLGEWTSLAYGSIEMGYKTFALAARFHRNVLPMRTGDLHRFTRLRLLDLKVRQMQFVGMGSASPNGCLNLGHLVLGQSLISLWTAMSTIGIDCIQISALLQVGKSLRQHTGVIAVI